MSPRLKTLLIHTCWSLLGRRNLVRLGRALLDGGRLDVWNQMESNGERLVQDCVLRGLAMGERAVFFDVGANLGLWSLALLDRARSVEGVQVTIHAFEPSRTTRGALERALEERGVREQIAVVGKALSNERGRARLFITSPFAGSNSLYNRSDQSGEQASEEIELETLDAYCEAKGVESISLLKIDAEGHDLAVLEGAGGMLDAGRIAALQFEYNWRWIDGRRFLRDAFELLGPKGYRIGKVTPLGIEFYTGWHPELETYREGNYLACRPDWLGRFPRIEWWNAREMNEATLPADGPD